MATSSLADQLTEDLKLAMKAGDTQRRDVIRFLRSAIQNQEIEVRHQLTDEEIESVIRRQVKQRRDSVGLYRSGGREDLAEAEEAEINVLEDYLPEQMTEVELHALIVAKADELGASKPADMRILMPALIEVTYGRADGRMLSQLATQELRRRAIAE